MLFFSVFFVFQKVFLFLKIVCEFFSGGWFFWAEEGFFFLEKVFYLKTLFFF